MENDKDVHFHKFIQQILEVLAGAIRCEKERKGIQIGKEEVKLSLFLDYIILYLEKLKDSTKKLLKHPLFNFILIIFCQITLLKHNIKNLENQKHKRNKKTEFTTAAQAGVQWCHLCSLQPPPPRLK